MDDTLDFKKLEQKIHDIRNVCQSTVSRVDLLQTTLRAYDSKLEELESELKEGNVWRAGFSERMEGNTRELRAAVIENLAAFKALTIRLEAVSVDIVSLKTKVAIYTAMAVFVATFGKEILMTFISKPHGG